jgi:predicted ATPase
MLKRLYVHNYKCLVNFEINFDKDLSLFLGANGSGKSTVFEVLAKLRRLIVKEEKVDHVFRDSNKPRWLKHEKTFAHFELDVCIENKVYTYSIETNLKIIKKESLRYNNEEIYNFRYDRDEVDDESEWEDDPRRSNLVRFSRSHKDSRIFIQYFRTLFTVRINPYAIGSTFSDSNSEIKSDFSNYAEWFAHLIEKHRKQVSTLEKFMPNVLAGLDYFRIEQTGFAKLLQIDFENPNNRNEIITYDFNELSEGQKVLIVIYTLIFCAPENSLICIDEPENFLALPEIQPWFDTLYDQCAERGLQAILISHHPKIINFLANDSGYWFSRENNLTRIQKISAENESGLSIAELIERGWIDEP